MRAHVLATLLLALSSTSTFAQGEGKGEGKVQISPPQSVPAQPAPSDQNAQQPRDQRPDRGQSKGDEREMGRDWRMRRGDGDRIGPDDRDFNPEMRGGHDEYRDRDKDRGRSADRDDRNYRDQNRADRDRDYRSYGEDWPRRRVKVCIEYDNGDEYCRYRQGR